MLDLKQEQRSTSAHKYGADSPEQSASAGPVVISAQRNVTHTALKCMAPHPRKDARTAGRICGEPGTRIPRVFCCEWTGRTYAKGREHAQDPTHIYSPCHNCGAVTEYRVVAPHALAQAA